MAGRKGFLGGLLALCFPDPIKEKVEDDTIADAIRGEQMLSIGTATPALLSVTAVNLFLTAYVLFDGANATILFGWLACGSVLVTAGIANTWKFVRYKFVARPAKSEFKAVYNAMLLGFVWAALPLLFFTDASSAQRVFIACVVAGMMGGGAIALSMLPAAAGALCITIGVGAMATLLLHGDLCCKSPASC